MTKLILKSSGSYGADELTGDNRTFESGVGGWAKGFNNTVSSSTDYAYTGSRSMKCTLADATEANRRLLALIHMVGALELSASTTYEMEFQIRHAGAFAGTVVSVNGNFYSDATFTPVTSIDPTTSWQKVVVRIEIGTDTTGDIRIEAEGTAPSQDDICYIDECRLREVL